MSDRPRVLVLDDEPQILRALRAVLRDAGYEALPAATVEEALDIAALRRPDAAILDLVLPDGDGVEVARELRSWSTMPILVLSAVGEEDEKVRALEAGADDYVTKPFGTRELVARLEAVRRRARPEPDEPVLRSGELELDLPAHELRQGGAVVHLTPTEWGLLETLLRHRGRVLTHRTLLGEVWGEAYRDDVPTLRAHVANLRHKLSPESAAHLRTELGVGYRWVD
jgi:two-component system KDP operon response regulator KdpE